MCNAAASFVATFLLGMYSAVAGALHVFIAQSAYICVRELGPMFPCATEGCVPCVAVTASKLVVAKELICGCRVVRHGVRGREGGTCQ